MNETSLKKREAFTAEEILEFVIFMGTEEKTKEQIREGLSKIFEGRKGDSLPGFLNKVKAVLVTKDGKPGLTARIEHLGDKKKRGLFKVVLTEDEVAECLQRLEEGVKVSKKNAHTTPQKIKVVEPVEKAAMKIEDPIVPILREVEEFFKTPEKYNPGQVKELLGKLPENLFDVWFNLWAGIQREQLEEQLQTIRGL